MNDCIVLDSGQLLPGPQQTAPCCAHPAWGCPPSRGVCLSWCLRTAAWPFCLQERGQWPLLPAALKENSVGEPEWSFHFTSHWGAIWVGGEGGGIFSTFPRERLCGIKCRPLDLEPRWWENGKRLVILKQTFWADFPYIKFGRGPWWETEKAHTQFVTTF